MPRKPTFKIRMEEWIEDCEARMLSRHTVNTYRKALSRVWRFARERGWPMDPTKITGHHVRDYYESLEDLATNTQISYMHVLLSFLKFGGNQNLERINLRIKPARTRVNWLSEGEVGLAIRFAHYPVLKAMLVIMSYTGMRVGELVRLQTKDLEDQQVTIRGKGRKGRVIPLDKEFWAEMGSYLMLRATMEDHPRFLVHKAGSRMVPYTEGGINWAVKNYGRSLNLHMTPHTLRRSFGRHLYLRGCPLAQLKELMGHSNVEMTIQYLGIGDSDIQQAISLYRPNYRDVYLSEPIQR